MNGAEESVLGSIALNLGAPTNVYLAACKPERFKLLQNETPITQYVDWEESIHEAAKKRNIPKEEANKAIDFLKKIFVYEKRLKFAEGYAHPLFDSDVHVNLDLANVPKDLKKHVVFCTEGLEIPLANCIHLPKRVDMLYKVYLANKLTHLRSRCETIEIRPGGLIRVSLHHKQLTLTEEEGDGAEPTDENNDGRPASSPKQVAAPNGVHQQESH
jgi:hypothetical protein